MTIEQAINRIDSSYLRKIHERMIEDPILKNLYKMKERIIVNELSWQIIFNPDGSIETLYHKRDELKKIDNLIEERIESFVSLVNNGELI